MLLQLTQKLLHFSSSMWFSSYFELSSAKLVLSFCRCYSVHNEMTRVDFLHENSFSVCFREFWFTGVKLFSGLGFILLVCDNIKELDGIRIFRLNWVSWINLSKNFAVDTQFYGSMKTMGGVHQGIGGPSSPMSQSSRLVKYEKALCS